MLSIIEMRVDENICEKVLHVNMMQILHIVRKMRSTEEVQIMSDLPSSFDIFFC